MNRSITITFVVLFIILTPSSFIITSANDNRAVETITHEEWLEGYNESTIEVKGNATASYYDHQRGHFWLKSEDDTNNTSYLYKVYENGTKEIVRESELEFTRVIHVTVEGTILLENSNDTHLNHRILRSTDGGETFDEVLNSSAFQGISEDRERGILYVGQYTGHGVNGIHRSVDDGETWELIWHPREWEEMYPDRFRASDYTHIHDLFYDDVDDTLYAVGGDGKMNESSDNVYALGVLKANGTPEMTSDFEWLTDIGRYTTVGRYKDEIYLGADGDTTPGTVTRFNPSQTDNFILESFIHDRSYHHSRGDPFLYTSGLYDDNSDDGLLVYPTVDLGDVDYNWGLIVTDGEKYVTIGENEWMRCITRNRKNPAPSVMVTSHDESDVRVFSDIDFDILTTPIEISDHTGTNLFNKHYRRYYHVTSDIDFNGQSGMFGYDNGQFDSVVYGNGYTFSNIVIDEVNADIVGLFREGGGNSKVKNLQLYNVEVNGGNFTGALFGRTHGYVSNVTIQKGDVSGFEVVGGIGGEQSRRYRSYKDVYPYTEWLDHVDLRWSKTVKNSSFYGVVNGEESVGGLFGRSNLYSSIKNSYTNAEVNNGGAVTGGLVGIGTRIIVSGVYSESDIVGNWWSGGLFGRVTETKIRESFFVGEVSGMQYTGGVTGRSIESNLEQIYVAGNVEYRSDHEEKGMFAGLADNSTFIASYYNEDLALYESVGVEKNSNIDIQSRTTDEMTYPFKNTYEGWDFDSVWIDGNHSTVEDYVEDWGYPALSYQNIIWESENDVSVKTKEAVEITHISAILLGELIQIGTEEVDVYFRYRKYGEEDWQSTEKQTLENPGIYEEEVENLYEDMYYEYKAVAEWEQDDDLYETKGDVLIFKTLYIHRPPPSLSITRPEDSIENLTYEENLTIEGITDPDGTIEIDGQQVQVDAETGYFEKRVELDEGLNVIEVVARDEHDNTAVEKVYALYLPEIPEIWEEIEYILKTVGGLEEDIQDLENNLKELETEYDIKLEELDERLNELENNFDENVTTLQDALNRLDDLEEDHEELQKEISEVGYNITEIKNNIVDVESDISELKEEYSDHEDEETDPLLLRLSIILNLVVLFFLVLILILYFYPKLKKKQEPNENDDVEEDSDEGPIDDIEED